MTVTARFAPSPTGLMHIGNARMALVNWLFVKKLGGTLILRLDDTDRERTTPAFANAIQEDLQWLGLQWDRLEKQSERFDAYDTAFERLKSDGRVYPCFESSEELEYKRRRALRAGRAPIYDRAALALSRENINARIENGEQPHWRFKLNHSKITFDDLVRGTVGFQGEKLSDPVIVRADGTYLYMMPSAVDDIDMRVTHVIRGEDHVSNSAIQVQLFEALGNKAPTFAHLTLLTDAGGAGLSKRAGSLSLQDLRDQGMEAMAVNSLLARLGTSEDIEPSQCLSDLASEFDMAAFGRATPKFDEERLWALNAKLIHDTSFGMVADRLRDIGVETATEEFWETIRPNLNKLSDAKIWYDICFADTTPVIVEEDRNFMDQARRLLPDEPWDETTWSSWTSSVKDASGRKGRSLFMPLRLVLTGLEHGPELKGLLPLIGRKRVSARLKGKTG